MSIFIFSLVSISSLGFFTSHYTTNTEKRKNQKEYFFILISFTVLFLVMALRSPLIGTDAYPYSNMFLRIGEQSSFIDGINTSGITAPGYVLFCRIIYHFFPFRQAWIIGCAFIVISLVFRFIIKTSKNMYLSVILYMTLAFYIQGFNGTRQYMAIAILLNAYTFWLENKKSIKGWGLYIIAILFHPTAIVGIAAWYLFNNNNYYKDAKSLKKIIVKSIVVGLISCFSQTILLSVFVSVFPRYSMYLSDSAVHSFSDQGQGRLIIIIFGYLVVCIYGIILLRIRSEIDDEEKRTVSSLLPIMMFAVVVGIFGARSLAISRMNSFFVITSISFIPNVLQIDSKSNRQILTCLTFAFTSAFMYIFLKEDKSDVVPYLFYWENF